jgi:hypothetical protein
VFPVDPDPALASAVPARELRVPTFPSLADIRWSINDEAPGLEFDDRISGKHFSYRGPFARIDDPATHTTTVADCTSGLAFVSNEASRSYRVLRMDPTTIDEHGPPDPYISHLRPPAAATLTFSPVDQARLKSPLATTGYTSLVSFSPFGPAQPSETIGEEQEFVYGILGGHPACERHTFDGEPLGIEPGLRPAAPTASEMRAYPPEIVTISGSPNIAPTNLCVHAEFAIGIRWQTIVDLTNIRASTVEPERFATPSGFTQDLSVRY